MVISNEVKKPGNFRSLSTTLATSFSVLSLCILFLVIGLEIYFNFQIQQKFIVEEQQHVAHDAVHTVEMSIQEKFGILEKSASIGSLETAGPKEQELVLDKLLGKVSSFRQLVLLNAQKKILAKASRLSETALGELVERAGSDLFSQISQKETYASQVYIDEVTQEPRMMIAVSVKDVFGDLKGVLMAEVDLKFMWDLVGNIKIGENGEAYVVDKQGNLIAYGDTGRVLKKENLDYLREVDRFVRGNISTYKVTADIVKGIKGTWVVSNHAHLGAPDWAVSNHAHLGAPDWAVMVEMPISEAYGEVIQMTLISLGIMFLSVFLIFIGSRHLAGRITKPIRELIATVQTIAGGDLTKRAEIKSEDEIGQLAVSFNKMVEDVFSLEQEKSALKEEYTKGLEEKVRERTTELERMNKLMTGRELKVIELKKEIGELKKSYPDKTQ